MGCLPHKESRNNFLADIKKKNFISNTGIIEIREEKNLLEYERNTLKTINRVYNLDLDKLFTIIKIERSLGNKPYYRTDVKEIVEKIELNENAFNQVDRARKQLNIYDSKESYGEYLKRNKKIQEIKDDISIFQPTIKSFNEQINKNDGIYPREFVTESGTWILNQHDLYDLVDKDGEILLKNINLETGKKEEPSVDKNLPDKKRMKEVWDIINSRMYDDLMAANGYEISDFANQFHEIKTQDDLNKLDNDLHKAVC